MPSLGHGVMQLITQCPTCPDSSTCARLLEEKWKQAYHAVFRFGDFVLQSLIRMIFIWLLGPPQPSMVYRYLRMLEGVSPPLSLTQTACQASAKAFTATRMWRVTSDGYNPFSTNLVFDRMFSLGVRGGGADVAPLGARVAAATGTAGPRRHFLYCTLRPEPASQRPRRSRDVT